jgi:hypothetical protein
MITFVQEESAASSLLLSPEVLAIKKKAKS